MTRACKTPGAVYSIAVHNGFQTVAITVSLPHSIVISAASSSRLKKRLHNAVEKVLSDTYDFSAKARLDMRMDSKTACGGPLAMVQRRQP